MPEIDKILKKKEFKRRSYRPWDLEGEEKNEDSPRIVDQSQFLNLENNQNGSDKSTADSIQKEMDTKTFIIPQNVIAEDKHSINYEETLETLVGYQRKILIKIAEIASSHGNYSTGPLPCKVLCDACEINSGILRLSIERLIKKGLLNRKKGKRGKMGFYSFEVPAQVFKTIAQIEKLINPVQK